MSIKAVKAIAAVILIWAACAPVTYTLLKRDWVRPHHSRFDFGKTVSLPWTVGVRSVVMSVCVLGPIGLFIATIITIADALPEGDPNVRAEW